MGYVMSFLMGLNNSYARVRGQLLLMDPIPPINKVFTLISQKEHQRTINLTIGTADSLAFYTRNDVKRAGTGQSFHGRSQKKDRPICTYCGYGGHTIDKCYKLHGYPPRYKSKLKDGSSSHTGYIPHPNTTAANQISGHIPDQSQGNYPLVHLLENPL